jgi:adenylosuccinate synthase
MDKVRAFAVIGAGFGDEGKGRMVDSIVAANGPDTLVIRYNGGAQAGHTVVTPDGRRHVFSHIGSGAFLGAETFLSRDFVVNPLLFRREMSELAPKLSTLPRITVDPRAIVTTPYDMMINEAVEDARGKARHGSVGVGFGETVERNLRTSYALTVSDLSDADRVRGILDRIRTEWVASRCLALGYPQAAASIEGLLASEQIRDRWIEDAKTFIGSVRVADAMADLNGRAVVFEGAQGLMLDQDFGWFPHVTRSNTGLRNLMPLMTEAGIDDLRVYHMTRAYLTRHGAGPLPGETDGPPYPGIVDETNRPHRYQGSLRFADLDVDLMARFIARDLADASGSVRLSRAVVVTCLDQVDQSFRWIANGNRINGDPQALLDGIATMLDVDVIAGYGPTRKDLTGNLSP